MEKTLKRLQDALDMAYKMGIVLNDDDVKKSQRQSLCYEMTEYIDRKISLAMGDIREEMRARED